MADEASAFRVTRYSIAFKGVFGRNRTPKFQSLTVIDVPEGEPLLELGDIEKRALATLVELKPKTGVWSISRNEVEIERHEGFKFEKFAPFSAVVILRGQIG